MTRPKGKLDTLCDSLGIRLVPVTRRRIGGQSHARATIKAIRAKHGDGHLIFTLRCIRETEPNKEALWSEVIAAVSDILLQRPDWQERASELFAALDTIDLNRMREAARQRRPWPVRETLRVGIYLELEERMDGHRSPVASSILKAG